MRQINATLSVLFLSLALTAVAQDSAQLTQVPPKPTCTPFLANGACANLWRNYNQALAQRQREELQLYVNRQKELASESATAPLQQQISDLTNLTNDQQAKIKKLQEQMQSDATAALETKQADAAASVAAQSEAHRQGQWEGAGIGAGVVLLLFVLIFVVRKLTGSFTITKKSQASGTSA
jgi:ElaB/YqjD/DUF883 family membrane-anchored ribosome-binding protein